jgi:hypothetical protein
MAVMKLGLAVNVKSDGAILHKPSTDPLANNSGYSVGFFQWDIGQNKNGKEFIEAYNNSNYVKEHPEKAIAEQDIAKYVKLLNQNRDSDGGVQKYDTIRRSQVGKDFNAFLATDDGYKFVMGLQEKQFEKELKPRMIEVANSKAVQNMSRDDAQIVLAAMAKVINQAGGGRFDKDKDGIKTLLSSETTTKDKIIDQIHSKYPKHVDEGVDATVKGANLYNKLLNDEGKLGEIFKQRNESDPINIPNFSKAPADQLMDGMFRQPDNAQKMVNSVNSGKDYIIKVSNAIKNEAYTVGVKDGTIFTIDKDGKGYKFGEDNKWIEFDNKEEKFLSQDKNGNWLLSEPKANFVTLKEKSRGDGVKELQENLNVLKEYGDISGDKLPVTGNFKGITRAAVEEFQQNNGLTVDGIVGPKTYKTIMDRIEQLKTNEQTSDQLSSSSSFEQLSESSQSDNSKQMPLEDMIAMELNVPTEQLSEISKDNSLKQELASNQANSKKNADLQNNQNNEPQSMP